MSADPVDDLYAGEPGAFTAARNDLVRELKRAGEKERAAEVAKLRRPSVAAWAVNQVVRRYQADVEDLLRVGADLRSAQGEALAGGDPDVLRDAARARRDTVARLVDRAAAIMAEHGAAPDAHRDAVAATLEAASLDPEAGEAVRRGRLSADLAAPSGFGDDAALLAPSGAARVDDDGDGDAVARDARYKARQSAKERRAEAERAEARAAAARRKLAKAEAEVEAAEHALSAARRRARNAADEVAEAERDADEARQEAERAASAADG